MSPDVVDTQQIGNGYRPEPEGPRKSDVGFFWQQPPVRQARSTAWPRMTPWCSRSTRPR